MTFLRRTLFVVLMAAVSFCASARAQEALTIVYETAPAVTGPWTPVDPRVVQLNPDGSATVIGSPTAFYRLRVTSGAQSSSIPVLSLAQVPKEVLGIATKHMQELGGGAGESTDEWSDVELAPFVAPLSNPGATGPSYYEFKVIGKPKPATKAGFRKFSSDENSMASRGYLICAADESDLPVPEFATEGNTPVEVLLRKTGGVSPARVIRYGAGFWVAESERGDLIANHGTEPFKIPAAMVEEMSTYNRGLLDSESARYDMPPATKLVPSGYENYAAFKADFETNAVYKLIRSRRAQHAKLDWNAERGITPTVLTVDVGETNTFLRTTAIDHLIVDDELSVRNAADVDVLRAGGIRVVGRFAGYTLIKVRSGERVTRYVVQVVGERTLPSEPPKAAAGGTYWQVTTEEYAGAWGDQKHYYQLRDDDWCDLVGCGPTAIAMLLGWWEHENSVESAFYTAVNNFSSLSTIDSPPNHNTTSERVTVRAVYRSLHELCDVICDPFGDSGATWPGDLIEGWAGYLHHVAADTGLATLTYGRGTPLVGYNAPWAWDSWGDDWHESGSVVAVGIKNGRPGIIGLGTLWHYAVAYGYKRKDQMYNVSGPDIPTGYVRRYLKCNEGWNGDSPSWYNAHEVFLGLSANMWQRKAPVAP